MTAEPLVSILSVAFSFPTAAEVTPASVCLVHLTATVLSSFGVYLKRFLLVAPVAQNLAFGQLFVPSYLGPGPYIVTDLLAGIDVIEF